MKYYRAHLELNELIYLLEEFEKTKEDFKKSIKMVITESKYAEGKYNGGFVDIENNMYFTIRDEFTWEFEFDLGMKAENEKVALEKFLNFWNKEYKKIKIKTIKYLEECLSRLK